MTCTVQKILKHHYHHATFMQMLISFLSCSSAKNLVFFWLFAARGLGFVLVKFTGPLLPGKRRF